MCATDASIEREASLVSVLAAPSVDDVTTTEQAAMWRHNVARRRVRVEMVWVFMGRPQSEG